MDVLKNKKYGKFTYLSRYASVPFYYHTVDGKEIYGLRKNMVTDIEFTSIEVRPEDSWDSLALKYYNNPALWWVIADFNNCMDSFIRVKARFDIVKVPVITQIAYKDLR